MLYIILSIIHLVIIVLHFIVVDTNILSLLAGTFVFICLFIAGVKELSAKSKTQEIPC